FSVWAAEGNCPALFMYPVYILARSEPSRDRMVPVRLLARAAELAAQDSHWLSASGQRSRTRIFAMAHRSPGISRFLTSCYELGPANRLPPLSHGLTAPRALSHE